MPGTHGQMIRDVRIFIVWEQDDKAIQVIEHGNLNFETEISNEEFYIVYSWGSNDAIFNEFDLRGH